MEILVSIQRKRISNVNMTVRKSNFDGIFWTNVFGSGFGTLQAEKLLLDIATFIMRKKYQIISEVWCFEFLYKMKYI